MQIALFDLDNTLLDGDCDVEWSDFLARHGAMDATRTRAFHEDYHLGTLDIDEFLRFQLEPLAREPLARLLTWRRECMVELLRPRISDAARALVNLHRRAGHELVLITATNRFLAEPIAAEFGIVHILATEPESIDGRFTGRVAGTPCFREGKVTRFGAWLKERASELAGGHETWFYSDSHNDLPLLSHVTHPVCVGPDAQLRSHALLHDWPIIELSANAESRRTTG
ncbi:MAG: HAD family hydrolase [Planctomycetes bacterium]|nr:HAD family hydrolase [Planctomycetota bacterium]